MQACGELEWAQRRAAARCRHCQPAAQAQRLLLALHLVSPCTIGVLLHTFMHKVLLELLQLAGLSCA